MFKNIQFGKLLFYVILCVAVGLISSFFTQSSIDSWFQALNKPWFNPPSWLFAPVWTTLYVLMGISAYMISVNQNLENKKNCIKLFYTQLVLNFLWSFSFFYLRNPFLGLINIVLLWIAIVLMIIEFSKISKSAAWLQIPYICWVSFATILNFTLWQLN